jgi:hypothetical protein
VTQDAQTRSTLVASGSAANPSLIVLRDKGYDLWLEPAEGGSLWCARKGAKSFLAYSGPELLGLVTLWEYLGEHWDRQQPDLYGELLGKEAG